MTQIERKNSDVVFRRIRGRIVPIRRKKDEVKLGDEFKKAGVAAGAAASGSYGAFEGVRRWFNSRKADVAKEVKVFRAMRPDPFTRARPVTPWNDVGKSAFHLDTSPMATIARNKYKKDLNAFNYAAQKSKKAWKVYAENAKPQLVGKGGLRFRQFKLHQYSKFVGSNMLNASLAIGAAAGVGTLAYNWLKPKGGRK